MYEQAEYRPVSKAQRNKWLQQGKKAGYSFLVITVSDSYPLEFKANYVTDKEDLFKVVGARHIMENSNVVEICNLACPLNPSADQALFTDLNLEIYKYPSSPPYYEKWQAEMEKYQIRPEGSWLPSQFDLDFWFETGRKKGRDYLIIVCQDSVYAEYYPIFADKSNLFDTITTYQKRVHCRVSEVYDLQHSFRDQYLERLCSTLPKPEIFYGERAETIREIFDDEGLDEIRRRIWEFLLTLGPIEGAIPLESYETAYELMTRCQTPLMRQSELMPILMLKAMELFPLENGDNHPAEPFYVIYDNLGILPWMSKASGQNMRNRDPLVREFAMSCQKFKSNGTNFDILLDIIPDFIEEKSDLRALLYLFWRYSGAKKTKRQLVRDWMKNPELGSEHKMQLSYSLRSDYAPQVFRPYEKWHSLYKAIYYRGEVTLPLFRQIDRDPVLRLPRELALTEKKAEEGDLNSQLILGAANLYGEGLEQNWAEGVKWATKAAEQNHPTGFLMLGDAYIRTNLPEYDFEKAQNYYKKAAELRYPQVWWILAEQYRYGDRVPQDFMRSLAYYIIAKQALQDTGNILEEGLAVMSSLTSDEDYAQAWVLAREIWGAGPWQGYEPLKYMNYFNPIGGMYYWCKMWN